MLYCADKPFAQGLSPEACLGIEVLQDLAAGRLRWHGLRGPAGEHGLAGVPGQMLGMAQHRGQHRRRAQLQCGPRKGRRHAGLLQHRRCQEGQRPVLGQDRLREGGQLGRGLSAAGHPLNRKNAMLNISIDTFSLHVHASRDFLKPN